MSTTTKKFGLIKLASSDPADITILNENWDKIDDELGGGTNIPITSEVPSDANIWIDPDEESVGGGVSSTASPVISQVTLLAAKWVGSGNLYSQVVNIDGVTANSQVDLTPSVEQLVIFYEKSLALVAENEDGVVTVYAIGQKPENDYTIQVTITEVIL